MVTKRKTKKLFNFVVCIPNRKNIRAAQKPEWALVVYQVSIFYFF